MRWIRESFAAKLFAGLLGTVSVLLVGTWVVVRAETNRQVDDATERAVASATKLFRALEDIQRQQLERVARPLVGRRIQAVLDAAVETGDNRYLSGEVIYELGLADLDDLLVVFTDPAGRPILTVHGTEPMEGVDPAGLAAVAQEVLNGEADERLSYRLLDGILFSVRTRLIAEAGRPVGTLSLGLPVDDEKVSELGGLLGVEVCVLVEGRCVAGTALGRGDLAPLLSELPAGSNDLRIKAMGSQWSVRGVPLVDREPAEGSRIIAVALDPVLAPFRRISRALLLGGWVALLLSALVGVALSRGLSRPVRLLVAATGRVARGEYDHQVAVTTQDELGTLAQAFNVMIQDLRLKERTRDVLNKVTSPEVAHLLLSGEITLGGENRAMTVLFADIRGFSALTEGMEPQSVIAILNQCMERLSRIVDEEGGTVDKYIGDEVMAFWGAPVGQADHALRAARAGLRMQKAMEDFSRERVAAGEPPLRIGVGLSSGVAVAGLMGSPDRWNYTVLGETVNLAARLCSSAGPGEVFATSETVSDAGPTLDAHSLGARRFKGFTNDVEVFSVDGVRGAPSRGHAGSGLGLLVLAAVVLAVPSPVSAQTLPTLRDAGAEYVSPSGAFQVTLSGQLDLEALWFQGTGAGLAWGEGLLVAPRLRVLGDIFLGEYLYVLLEARADRGEAPRAGVEEVRMEQAFLRASNRSGSFSVQAGRFASPFGSYPLRHLSIGDPFLRPPLLYDYPTMMCPGIAPPDAARFLAWQADPATFRQLGAPPVWAVPYQWGAMVAGVQGPLSYRVAAMNSAPSSAPEAWAWDSDQLRHPSWVAGVGLQLSQEFHVGASYDRGPWLTELDKGKLPVGRDRWSYMQELLSADVTYARGPAVARVEVVRDRWEVPNVPGFPVEWGVTAELQTDLGSGWSAAIRGGMLDFRPLEDGDVSRDWDYDMFRWEAAMGYRLAQNAGVLATWAVNDQRSPLDPADDLVGIRLWWSF